MAKKTTLNELGEMLEHLVTSIADLPTKADLDDKLKPIETRLTAVESKLAGIDKRLDIDAIKRDHDKLPTRVGDLEQKVFGKSRAPQHPAI